MLAAISDKKKAYEALIHLGNPPYIASDIFYSQFILDSSCLLI